MRWLIVGMVGTLSACAAAPKSAPPLQVTAVPNYIRGAPDFRATLDPLGPQPPAMSDL